MRAGKTWGTVLFVLGCMVFLLGLGGLLLPKIGNGQLELLLTSFSEEGGSPFVRFVNKVTGFVFSNAAGVTGSGLVLLLIGLLLANDPPAEGFQPVKAQLVSSAILAEEEEFDTPDRKEADHSHGYLPGSYEVPFDEEPVIAFTPMLERNPLSAPKDDSPSSSIAYQRKYYAPNEEEEPPRVTYHFRRSGRNDET